MKLTSENKAVRDSDCGIGTMKTQSLVLYGSKTKLTSSHRQVSNYPFPYYVRVESSQLDYVAAFGKAISKPGETFLNTVPYETNT